MKGELIWRATVAAGAAWQSIVHRSGSRAGLLLLPSAVSQDFRGWAELIEGSGLFDKDWYLKNYPDVAAAGIDPVVHFLSQGAAEGRDPNPLFDTRRYLGAYPDVAAAALNPLAHYLSHGVAEARNPNPLFDTRWYLGAYPDVAAAAVNPLAHYLSHGVAEGRDPNPLFDTRWYLGAYPDVAAAAVNPLAHYLSHGVAEGRDPNPLFDTRWYVGAYPDVAAAAVNPLAHYLSDGVAEGRNPNPLFDTRWYLGAYPDVAAAAVNPLAHYLSHGAAEGRDPNPLFDTRWYLGAYPDVAAAAVNPLAHYLSHGVAEGRNPNPLFDTRWYLGAYPDVAAAAINPLAHYLSHGIAEGRDPNPLFDTRWYLDAYPDVAAAAVNPLVHYARDGAIEGRAPSPYFDIEWYLAKYPDLRANGENPLAHYLSHGKGEGHPPWLQVSSNGNDSLERYLNRNLNEATPVPGPEEEHLSRSPVSPESGAASNIPETAMSPDTMRLHADLYACYVKNVIGEYSTNEYASLATTGTSSEIADVKLIAYYLPQFHPIPENDSWWGKGFTEWRNVVRAFPLFDGHYQPHLPGELGYYDLRLLQVMRRQVELAQLYGITAFCFHFYWFGGRRLLEIPLLNYLDNRDLDLNFSLCWANENWSRGWDGREKDILISQDHSPDDDIAFIRYVSRYFSDERYVKVGGKPVLTIYRPSTLPDAAATAQRWREEVDRLGFPGIYLVATNAFGFQDFQKIGFDALSEFPPHNVQATNIQHRFKLSPFRSGRRILSYPEFVAIEKEKLPTVGSVIHPGVMPSWDNSPRKPTWGEIIHGSTPALFREWLDLSIRLARDNPIEERFVFINAWNEWAEGAHLEPDRRFGYAYLESCAAALRAGVGMEGLADVK